MVCVLVWILLVCMLVMCRVLKKLLLICMLVLCSVVVRIEVRWWVCWVMWVRFFGLW